MKNAKQSLNSKIKELDSQALLLKKINKQFELNRDKLDFAKKSLEFLQFCLNQNLEYFKDYLNDYDIKSSSCIAGGFLRDIALNNSDKIKDIDIFIRIPKPFNKKPFLKLNLSQITDKLKNLFMNFVNQFIINNELKEKNLLFINHSLTNNMKPIRASLLMNNTSKVFTELMDYVVTSSILEQFTKRNFEKFNSNKKITNELNNNIFFDSPKDNPNTQYNARNVIKAESISSTYPYLFDLVFIKDHYDSPIEHFDTGINKICATISDNQDESFIKNFILFLHPHFIYDALHKKITFFYFTNKKIDEFNYFLSHHYHNFSYKYSNYKLIFNNTLILKKYHKKDFKVLKNMLSKINLQKKLLKNTNQNNEQRIIQKI